MVYSIQEIQARILPVAEKYGLHAVYLFGSYARGQAREDSDIDLLVDLAGTKVKGMFALSALFGDLEDALEKSIDLVTVSALAQAPQMPSEADFRDAVLKERVELHSAA